MLFRFFSYLRSKLFCGRNRERMNDLEEGEELAVVPQDLSQNPWQVLTDALQHPRDPQARARCESLVCRSFPTNSMGVQSLCMFFLEGAAYLQESVLQVLPLEDPEFRRLRIQHEAEKQQELENLGVQLRGACQEIARLKFENDRLDVQFQSARSHAIGYLKQLSQLKAETATKERETEVLVNGLNGHLQETSEEIAVLRDQLSKRAASVESTSFAFQGSNPAVIDEAIHRVSQGMSIFCKRIIENLRESLGSDEQAANRVCADSGYGGEKVCFPRLKDVRFVVQSAVASRMFLDFENESFSHGGQCAWPNKEESQARHRSQAERLLSLENESESEWRVPLDFWRFFEEKSRNVATYVCHLLRLKGLKGSVLNGAFRMLAKDVFILHELSFALNQPAEIIRRDSGGEIDELCELVKGCEGTDFAKVPVIALVTMPGFRVGSVVVTKCHVYPVYEKRAVATPAQLRG